MGVIATVRQTFFDAQHYTLDQADFLKHPAGRARPAYNLGKEALAPTLEKKMRVVFEPQDALMVDRSARIAHELDLDFYIVSSGEEWRRPKLAKAAGVPFIVPLNSSDVLPKMPQEDDWEQVTLDQLRAWDWAPENAAVLQNQGVEIALTTYGNSMTKKIFTQKSAARGGSRTFRIERAGGARRPFPPASAVWIIFSARLRPASWPTSRSWTAKVILIPRPRSARSGLMAVFIGFRWRKKSGEEGERRQKDGTPNGDECQRKLVLNLKTPMKQARLNQLKLRRQEKPEATAGVEKSKADKKEADKEAKLAKLKELQKRVARPPLEGRGVLATATNVLIRNVPPSGPADQRAF